ncbi:NAD(P)-dependent oxidoreductase [Micromonosporaceae bacterium B7E4]
MDADINRAVVVVGGTGCVGLNMADVFARHGHEVVLVSRRPPTGAAGARHRWVAADVAAEPPARLASMLEATGARTVVNAAGGWSPLPEANQRMHVRLVTNLLAAIAAVGPTRPRLIHIGSIHEYGPTPAGTRITERHPTAPEGPYAASKLAGTAAVLRATEAGEVSAVVLRAVNLCGPGTPSASFLGMLTERLRSASPGQPAEVVVGAARRDFLDARDLARAALLASGAGIAGQILNIGGGEAVAIRDVVRMLVSVAGLPPDAVRLRDGAVGSKGGDWTLADIGLARRLLGWEPRITLRDSLADMWFRRDHETVTR